MRRWLTPEWFLRPTFWALLAGSFSSASLYERYRTFRGLASWYRQLIHRMKISVIIPTHNRPEKLAATVNCLRQQDFPAGEYEIVVVDDGSEPPVTIQSDATGVECRVVRLEGLERSAARKCGRGVHDRRTVGLR
jgi:cellulose synthase/poly-beta-1,6-N-acetylglucosamine synthase-like glycosyltransferase